MPEKCWPNDKQSGPRSSAQMSCYSGSTLFSKICLFKIYVKYNTIITLNIGSDMPQNKCPFRQQNAVSDQGLHCLLLIQEFLNTSAGGKRDIQILQQIFRVIKLLICCYKFAALFMSSVAIAGTYCFCPDCLLVCLFVGQLLTLVTTFEPFEIEPLYLAYRFLVTRASHSYKTF